MFKLSLPLSLKRKSNMSKEQNQKSIQTKKIKEVKAWWYKYKGISPILNFIEPSLNDIKNSEMGLYKIIPVLITPIIPKKKK
jgi:hypothetical protein